MSISRRQFILGTASGLILPSYFDKVLAVWENHGEALIEAPESTHIELIAVDRGGAGTQLAGSFHKKLCKICAKL
jgi:hypothetical protein